MSQSVLLAASVAIAAMTSSAHAAEAQAHSGRIDVYAVDQAFDLAIGKASPRAQVTDCSWLGADNARTGVSCTKRLGPAWEEVWIEFTSLGAGQVDIDIQGEYYPSEGADDVRLVWADSVSVEGAEIENSDFEEKGAGGGPNGWRFTGALPPERYSTDGSVARSGQACVAVWYGGQARQAFAVEAGETYRVRAWFRVMQPELVTAPMRVERESLPEMYSQEVSILFATEEAAEEAVVEVLPLYNGYEWAISSRWDDNNAGGDRAVHDALEKHGHHATWYLNETNAQLDAETANSLLEGGNSLGGHSLTHPMLAYLSRNRIFEEVAGIRADREASSDTLIVSYAFSFCHFQNALEGDIVHADIARALERAGYYSIANGWFNDAVRAPPRRRQRSVGCPSVAKLDVLARGEWVFPPTVRPDHQRATWQHTVHGSGVSRRLAERGS